MPSLASFNEGNEESPDPSIFTSSPCMRAERDRAALKCSNFSPQLLQLQEWSLSSRGKKLPAPARKIHRCSRPGTPDLLSVSILLSGVQCLLNLCRSLGLEKIIVRALEIFVIPLHDQRTASQWGGEEGGGKR